MVNEKEVSAFAAYNTNVEPLHNNKAVSNSKKNIATKAKSSKSDLSNLSHDDMVAEIILKKKQQLKRKRVVDDSPKTYIKLPKLSKRKKKALAAANLSQEKAVEEPTTSTPIHKKKTVASKSPALLQVNKQKETAPMAGPIPVVYQNGNTNHLQETPKKSKSSAKNASLSLINTFKSSPKSPSNIRKAIITSDSIKEGEKLFSWLIHPVEIAKFKEITWEKSPILVHRKCAMYYSEIMSTAAIDKMLRDHRVEFGKNLDVTSYKDGVRETLNPEGRAMPPTVWDYYRDGCSIRLLNPQTFLPSVHSMNATLQEYFQCMTGANVYLTPANSQGFAPHYDDIEAFVLQIEGKKHWKVYKPRTEAEFLPRVSSGNFQQSEIGEPMLDVILEAGDLLYFPRGYIHQATTVPDHHSLHITLSVYQKHSYGDLLELLMPMAVQTAIDQNVSLREGLPLDMWQVMGLVNSDKESAQRTAIIKKLRSCFDAICKAAPLDDAVDQMAKRYQHDALPPYLTSEERARTVYGTAGIVDDNGTVDNPMLELDTPVRLLRANSCRMLRQGNEFRIYYHADNSKEYHEIEEQFCEVDASDAPAVEVLINSYPHFITPAELLLDDNERNLAVAQDLWERGILMTENVLE